jgi:hypothetical protein
LPAGLASRNLLVVSEDATMTLAFPYVRQCSGPLADRMTWALRRRRQEPRPSHPPFRLFAPRRQQAASEHLYFSVRPMAAAGGRQLLQFGFADDRGNIVLSVVGESALASSGPPFEPAEDLAAEPMDSEWLSILVGSVCRGASLVAFHKILQSGLLPPGVIEAADSVECAWRRYVRLSQRRGTFDRADPVTLDDALEVAGLGAVGAEDAALRARGVRELWAWMDRVE